MGLGKRPLQTYSATAGRIAVSRHVELQELSETEVFREWT